MRLFVCPRASKFIETEVTSDDPLSHSRPGSDRRKHRKAAGLTVHDLQLAFGFNSPQAIYKWQNGTALPTVDNLIGLAALLKVHIDDILIVNSAA